MSCPALCNPMNCSRPGFPVLHCLLEFAQSHVRWVGDAIQASHFLSPPSHPALTFLSLIYHLITTSWNDGSFPPRTSYFYIFVPDLLLHILDIKLGSNKVKIFIFKNLLNFWNCFGHVRFYYSEFSRFHLFFPFHESDHLVLIKLLRKQNPRACVSRSRWQSRKILNSPLWVSESGSVLSDSLRPHGLHQARILEWIAFPSSRGSS